VGDAAKAVKLGVKHGDAVVSAVKYTDEFSAESKHADGITIRGSRQSDIFRSDADPLRATYGSARESHPDEYQAAMNELKEAGVEIDYRSGSMAYSPQRGKPGKIILDPDSSIGALRHEMQHVRDARDADYPGIGPYVVDANRFWEMEYRGYMQEVRFARSQRDFENARKIVAQMRTRRQEIFDRYGDIE
jgi:hypothetical protein